jgi:hypothetical protein
LLSKQMLEDAIHAPKVSTEDKALLCLAFGDLEPKKIADVRKIGVEAGWAGAKRANLSLYLSRSTGLAAPTPHGWKLTTNGQKHIAELAGAGVSQVTTPLTQSLRLGLAKVKNPNTQKFIEEAILCIEHGLFRSAVVLSWVGAMAVIYDYVVVNKLADVNKEALSRNAKWKIACTADDLTRIEEFEFLQILGCPAVSVLQKNVKQELEGCLKLRNACGHPNSFKFAETKVAAHVETLMLNVFDTF